MAACTDIRSTMIKHLVQWITNRFAHKGSVIQGSCNQCGHCCRNLLLYDGDSVIRNRQQLDRLLARQPHYEFFEPMYQDEDLDGLYFSCRHIGEDNRCQIYATRPAICDDYPNPRMFLHGARLPEACSYELTPRHTFASHMKQQKSKLKRNK